MGESSRERARHIGAVLGPDTRQLVAIMRTLPTSTGADRGSALGHHAAGEGGMGRGGVIVSGML